MYCWDTSEEKNKKQVVQYLFFPQGCVTCLFGCAVFVILLGVGVAVKMVVGFTSPDRWVGRGDGILWRRRSAHSIPWSLTFPISAAQRIGTVSPQFSNSCQIVTALKRRGINKIGNWQFWRKRKNHKNWRGWAGFWTHFWPRLWPGHHAASVLLLLLTSTQFS